MEQTVEVGGRSFLLSESLSSAELAPIFADAWTASKVWAASRFLGAHLVSVAQEPRQARHFQPVIDDTPATVVELGSGCGLVGLVAASLGADVLLTDQHEAVELLERNVRANAKDEDELARLRVSEFVWGTSPRLPHATFDYVLVSDCINPIYGRESWRNLARSIVELSHRETVTWLAHESRGGDAALDDFLQCCEPALEVELVKTEGKMKLFCLRCRTATT